MRTNPYPVPPSLSWSSVMVASYASMIVAGGLTLVYLVLLPQPVAGALVLAIWGGLTLPAAAACLYGVVARRGQGRYRFEWIGTWFLAMGTSVYLVVTVLGQLAVPSLLAAAPFILAGGAVIAAPFALLLLLGRRRSRRGWVRVGLGGLGGTALLAVAAALIVGLGPSAPTVLVFCYAVGLTLARAVQLSLIDLQARRRVLVERAVGEVATDE